jgi:hypothetical protein
MSDAPGAPDEGAVTIQPDRRVSRHHPVRVTGCPVNRTHQPPAAMRDARRVFQTRVSEVTRRARAVHLMGRCI